MYFLVQSNIYLDPDHDKIFDALEDLGIAYEAVTVKSTDTSLPITTDRKDVFVYGSVQMARLAKQYMNWYPGSFYGGNHLYEIYAKQYGSNLLNDAIRIAKLTDDLVWQNGEKKFIKPYQVAKAFTGKVFEKEEWEDFIIEGLAHPKRFMKEDMLIQIAKPKETIKEARLWIVGGQIIDAGYYKFNGDFPFEATVATEGIAFAKEMIGLFNVEEAFVMDICYTLEGWKIVEINCINSSGFYTNTNVKSILKALDIYFTHKIQKM